MLKQRTSPLLALLAILLIALAGCSNDDPIGPAGSEIAGDDWSAIDFDAPFGGLTMADEPIAFGDPELLEGDTAIEGEVYDDPVADEPEVRALMEMMDDPTEPGDPDQPQRPQFTFVKILWGKIGVESEPPVERLDDGTVIDWSGELTVDRGIVVVRRVIGFYGPDSYLVQPRPDRRTVVWQSQVSRGHHGLLIQIIEPPHRNRDGQDDPDDPPPPNMLHFSSGPFSQSFEVCDLAEMDMLYDVDVPDQAISFTGFTLDNSHPCPQGMMIGRWLGDQQDGPAEGTFRGRWVGLNGPVTGYMRGAYGINENGERVMFGKYIGRNGRCLGLLAGTWEIGPRPGYGWFQGRWFGRHEELRGRLRGEFQLHETLPVGSFQGRWSGICD